MVYVGVAGEEMVHVGVAGEEMVHVGVAGEEMVYVGVAGEEMVHVGVAGEENANYEAKKVHLDNLYRMVQYCENSTDCRRSQQMAYFGELFDRRHCGNMKKALCDNCASKVRLTILKHCDSCRPTSHFE